MCHRAALLVSLLLPLSSFAQEDDEGTKDHPDIPRFPGFFIARAGHEAFNGFDFWIDGEGNTKNKEGEYWHHEYILKEGGKQPGAVEIARNFENAAKKRGGKVIYEHHDSEAAHLTVVIPIGKSERWLQIMAYDRGQSYTQDVVDVKAMQQQLEMDASAMLEALNKDGFVALHGILFDTGKDTIKPESEPVLKEIASLLQQSADLKLSIEGHTDNVGNAKANKALSEKRAASVKKWLAGKGIAVARLTTKGWGDTKPVADNRTDDGRAQNRRVELVKVK